MTELSNSDLTQACLREIGALWRAAQEQLRPEAVWIAQHQPLFRVTDQPDTPIVRAWFLDSKGLHSRQATDYIRFIAIHAGNGWASGSSVPPALGVFNNRPGRTHSIGLAAFASIRDSELIYLHNIWGGTSGRGSLYKLTASDAHLHCVKNVWLS